MKIVFLSPLPPYRGGIAQFGKMLLASLKKLNHDVFEINYSHLYPDVLFPGKTQFEEADSQPDGILHSYNPFSWAKTKKIIKQAKPDLIISQWWHPFFAPCLTSVIPKNINSVAICHNITPHESLPFAKQLTTHYLKKQNLLVVHSKKAEEDAEKLNKTVLRLFHPIYNQYENTGLTREKARKKLELEPKQTALLFFGLVRDYKGLDLLIKAMDFLPDNFRIIAAGENYTNRTFSSPKLLWENNFIPDREVGSWFNASDIVVLPYKTATQSGIAQIALAFNKPLVVTNQGGLPETVVNNQTGVIAQNVTPESIADAILQCSKQIGNSITMANIKKKASEFSWVSYAEKLMEAVK